MKYSILFLPYIFICTLLIVGCKSKEDDNQDEECVLTEEQESFYDIDIEMNFEDVKGRIYRI